jgi:hypothetical protein
MERMNFLPVPARKQLFTCRTTASRLSLCEVAHGLFFAVCFLLSRRLISFSDYLFVNKHHSRRPERTPNIYLPRKGVLDSALTCLKEAKAFFLNTKGWIFYLSGSTCIPITLLSGMTGDRSTAFVGHNDLFLPTKYSFVHQKTYNKHCVSLNK